VLVSVGLKASSRPSGGLAPLSAVSLTGTEPNLRRLIEKLDSQPLITLLRAPPALPSSLLGGAEGPELDPSVRKVRRHEAQRALLELLAGSKKEVVVFPRTLEVHPEDSNLSALKEVLPVRAHSALTDFAAVARSSESLAALGQLNRVRLRLHVGGGFAISAAGLSRDGSYAVIYVQSNGRADIWVLAWKSPGWEKAGELLLWQE
jgi:hypothetical protein